ncbi:hypothetical protein [Desulfocurvibacter africanus]|uniref:hypothetical protein n=1 Tax=Desulfocurvibacter africanus TaxID=873 RepID=UPI000424AA10|nr:hypothetical protein [Desulfocurvibacter africanus]
MSTPERLAQALNDHLHLAQLISDEVVQFARTALGVDAEDPKALWRAVDDDSPEREALVELMLFPSSKLVVELEPLLAQECYSDEDEPRIVERLLSFNPGACFALPGGGTLTLLLRAEDARLLVRRLRIEDTPPEELRQAASGRFDAQQAAQLMALLRHESWPDTPQSRFLLSGVLERLSDKEAATAEALRYACRFLASLAPDAEPLAALKHRHAETRRGLERARRFQAMRETMNMETLMARGVREPNLDPAALEHELALQDAICRAAYGLPASDFGPAEEDLGEFDGEEGARRLLDIWGE